MWGHTAACLQNLVAKGRVHSRSLKSINLINKDELECHATVCVYGCISVCAYLGVCLWVFAHFCVRLCPYICILVCSIYVSEYVLFSSVSLRVCLCVHLSVYVYLCVCTHAPRQQLLSTSPCHAIFFFLVVWCII